MKIQWFLPLIGLLFLTFSGCGGDEEEGPDQLALDIEAIDQFLEENNLSAEEHESGLRYRILNSGNGDRPAVTDVITVSYEGRLMTNGNIFDESENLTFPLNQLIAGWQIGIPLISPGGRIILYIPSTLAYGSRQVGSIPPNSNLIFEITLIGIQ
jgi:FKBP-type peptidyl-prolyl cis-trans isomerase